MYSTWHLHQLKREGGLMMETHLVLHRSRSMIDYVAAILYMLVVDHVICICTHWILLWNL